MLSRDLRADEVSMLEKSLNFAISLDTLPVKDVIIDTENYQITRWQLNYVLGLNTLSKHQRSSLNVTRGGRSVIKELRKDDSILILPADKGTATVVIDATSYE